MAKNTGRKVRVPRSVIDSLPLGLRFLDECHVHLSAKSWKGLGPHTSSMGRSVSEGVGTNWSTWD